LDNPLVSIVIPTYNSEATLPICLESIRRQSYKNIEVVVVDKGSVDRSVEIAKKFGAKVYISGPERSSQMNYGALKSSGELLYFVGADFLLSRNVVEESVNLIESGNDAVIVLNISNPKPSLTAKIRYFERISYYGSNIYEAARFIKRDLFFRVGGFDPRLYTNEDYDLQMRLVRIGAKIARTRRSFEIHIDEPSSFKTFIIKNLYYGKNIQNYLRKNPYIPHIITLRPTFLSKWFISYAGRKWLPSLFLVPTLKFIQGIAVLIGLTIRPSVSPYRKRSKEINYDLR
jgi:glycosyltransferase involved in cell wall biosynthesis